MNRALIIILSLLVSFAVTGQSKKERKKARVRSTTEWETVVVDGKPVNYKVSFEEYDREGRVTQHVDYAPDGAVIFKTTSLFNSRGDKTEETEYDPLKKRNFRRTYKYNALGDKTEEVEYDGNGSLVSRIVSTYDANGNRISETETDVSGNLIKKTIITYNSKGLKSGRHTTGGSKQKEKEKVKKWDYVYY